MNYFKKIKTIFPALLLTMQWGTVHASTSHTSDMEFYLCIGQSNMAGRASIPSELTAKHLDNVWLFNQENKFEKASLPLNKYSNIRKDINMQGLGPSWSFALQIVERNHKKPIGIVVNARGGSAIQQWEKGEPLYEKTLIRVQEALKKGKLKAILWHQGESNCDGKYLLSASEYKKKLIELVTNLRKDLGCDTLPIVIGQLGRWKWAKPARIKEFNQMLSSLPAELPYTACVSSEGLKAAYPGTSDPHFGTEAQLELGKRYAEAVIQLLHTSTTHQAVTSVPSEKPSAYQKS